MRKCLVVAMLAFATACSSGRPAGGGQTNRPVSPSQASPLPQGADNVRLDPSQFQSTIDHRYWPMKPGSTWVFRESAADGSTQRVEITVTAQTRNILGIRATVVHDVVSEDGQLVEDTFDWYAQDRLGNLWYLGEDTKEYENGKVVSTEGSWEAGVDGAQAGILLPAAAAVGMVYRQEYYEGHAEDAAEVLSLDETADVPYGVFNHVLQTKDYTPLDPELVEEKFYAEGVGLVLAVAVGSSDREELISFHRG